MKRLLIASAVLLVIAPGARAGQTDGCAGATVRQTVTVAMPAASATVVSHNGNKVIYVCAVNIGPLPAVTTLAMVYGTKTTTPCDTGTVGLFGGTTPATEWNFAANGGLTYGNGVGVLAIVPAGQDLCVLEGLGGTLSGAITYAQY